MNKDSFSWRIYKLVFLDVWHRKFFNSQIKPQEDFLEGNQLKKYLDELNVQVIGFKEGKQYSFDVNQPPTLFFANHPSTLDALFTYKLLQKVNPYFVSFIHNKYHFKFLEKRMIPVAAFFAAEKINLLGMKMRLAKRLENLNENEAHEINRKVPSEAVKLLSQGKSVVIYPSGGWGRWQDGVGFIIVEYLKQNPGNELILQPLKSKSFREIHQVIHGLMHCLGIKVLAKVKIEVGDQYFISEIGKKFSDINDEKSKAKAITICLEEEYKKI